VEEVSEWVSAKGDCGGLSGWKELESHGRMGVCWIAAGGVLRLHVTPLS